MLTGWHHKILLYWGGGHQVAEGVYNSLDARVSEWLKGLDQSYLLIADADSWQVSAVFNCRDPPYMKQG